MYINPYETSVNKANTYWMAKISRAVYRKISKENPAPDEVQMLQDLQKVDKGFKSVRGYSQNRAQGALVEHEQYLCMVFRGTDETMDWHL